jgi:hypothetical protein
MKLSEQIAIDALHAKIEREVREHMPPSSSVDAVIAFTIGILIREIALLQAKVEERR